MSFLFMLKGCYWRCRWRWRQVFMREVRMIISNKDIRLMCFVAPVLYGIILTSVYYPGRINKIEIGFIDNDRSALSRASLRALDATENIKITDQYTDPLTAGKAIINGDISGFIYFPRNFSAKIKRGGDTYQSLAISSSNFLIANPVITTVSESAGVFSNKFLVDSLIRKGVSPEKGIMLTSPLNLTTNILFNAPLSYAKFMIPPLLYAILQQIILVSLAFTMA
ncbi:MAG: ABC transporter permease, partial [Oligoflexia bacterium]|nr:ABC transporter permease [Oligoflexia bacterium]